MNFRRLALLPLATLLCWAPSGNSQSGAAAPALTIGVGAKQQVLLTWPTNAGDFVLETATTLGDQNGWSPQTNGLNVSGSNLVLAVTPQAKVAFYRLHKINGSLPITAPALTWTWVPFSDCFCMEGTTTGIGVNLSTNGDEVLLYLMGGGACWDYTTCYLLNTATHGPFGEVEFTNLMSQFGQTWFLDRSSPANPFQNYNYVLVPYCTGDIHAGSKINVYGPDVTMQVGFQNIANYLERLVPTFPAVKHIVIAGSSAGGYGAVFNWMQTQQAFGNVRVDVIDDSGPIMTPDVLAQGYPLFLPGSEPMTNWNFQAAVPATCDSCATNVSSIYDFIASASPPHRLALLSYTQDQTIRSYLGLSAQQFANGLTELAAAQFNSPSNRAYFFISGQSHVLLADPTLTVNGVTLQQFITQMVTDDPGWKSP